MHRIAVKVCSFSKELYTTTACLSVHDGDIKVYCNCLMFIWKGCLRPSGEKGVFKYYSPLRSTKLNPKDLCNVPLEVNKISPV